RRDPPAAGGALGLARRSAGQAVYADARHVVAAVGRLVLGDARLDVGAHLGRLAVVECGEHERDAAGGLSEEAPEGREVDVVPGRPDLLELRTLEASAGYECLDPAGVAHREDAGRVALRRLHVAALHQDLGRDDAPRVVLRRAPDREAQPPAGPQDAPRLA